MKTQTLLDKSTRIELDTLSNQHTTTHLLTHNYIMHLLIVFPFVAVSLQFPCIESIKFILSELPLDTTGPHEVIVKSTEVKSSYLINSINTISEQISQTVENWLNPLSHLYHKCLQIHYYEFMDLHDHIFCYYIFKNSLIHKNTCFLPSGHTTSNCNPTILACNF